MNHLDSGKGIGFKLNVGDALKASQNADFHLFVDVLVVAG